MLPGEVLDVFLSVGEPELYTAGRTYAQAPDEIHRTFASDGTVTVLNQSRRDVDTARVFWPAGGVWGDAIPRQATAKEVNDVCEYALVNFG